MLYPIGRPVRATITLYPIGRPVRATITLYPIGRPVRATITLYPIGRPVRATITLYPIGRPVRATITLYPIVNINYCVHTIQDSYDSTFLRKVAQCPLLTVDQVLTGQSAEAKEVRVEYTDRDDFGRKARKFHVMDDFKVG